MTNESEVSNIHRKYLTSTLQNEVDISPLPSQEYVTGPDSSVEAG